MTSSPRMGLAALNFWLNSRGQQKTDDKLEHDAHNRVEKGVSKGVPEIRIPQHLHIIFKTVEFYSACVKASDGHALKTDDPVIEDGEAHESDHKQERGQGEKISGAFFSCYSHMNLLLLIISRLIQMKGGSFFQSEDPPFPAAKSLYASASVLCPAVLFFRVNLVNLCLGLRHSVSRRCFPENTFW